MVPEGWPAAAPAGDRSVELARGAGRNRLSTVRQDFFLSPRHRLTDQERALMTSMLHGLIADIGDELRAGLGSSTGYGEGADVVAELSASGLLDRPSLVSLLLRSAEEEQAAASVRQGNRRRESQALQTLISDEHPAIAAAAMALIVARGRRQDSFGQMKVDFDDFPAEEARAIVYAVAAAISPNDSNSMSAMVDSAGALVERHDPSRSLDALASELVIALDDSARLSDEFIAAAAEEPDIGLLLHALARRAGTGFAEVCDDVYSRDDRGIALLLQMAGVSRDCAATIVSSLSAALGIPDPERAIDLFDDLKPQDVDRARAWLALPASYRFALLQLGKADGQRAV